MSSDIEQRPLLEARNVHKSFGETAVLRGVDFQLRHGESCALLGPSGCGKSTLLALLCGLERPDAGEVLVEGTALNGLAPDDLALLRRHKIGVIFQAFHLIPSLTALDNVALPLYPEAITPQERSGRAEDLLRRVGLSHRLRHRPGQLSGGEKQRVAIARALINNPALILGDEPTGNLDSRTGEEIVELLLSLQQEQHEKMSLLLVTHAQSLAGRMHRVVTMQDGRIMEPMTEGVQ